MKISKIIIHHSLTKDGEVKDWDAIKRYHINEKNFVDIGYNYGVENIKGKHQILKGRAEGTVGAHTKGMNSKSIGICVVGNYDLGSPPDEAMKLLASLCAELCAKYKLRPADIDPHSKYAPKTCPGTKFPMNLLREMVRERLEEE